MDTLFVMIGSLGLITAVYVTAYRSGYKASQAKAEAIIREYATPVNELLQKIEDEVARSESNPPHSN
jgi:hypothetical protein